MKPPIFLSAASAEQLDQFLDAKAAGTDQAAQSALRDLLMVRNGKRGDLPWLHHDHVTAVLVGRLPSGAGESLHYFPATDIRQRRHQATTSSSSVSTVNGIPRSARTSRHAAIASRAFSRASARVFPWLTQPGIAGHSTIHIPSSSRVIEVMNFIRQTLTPPRLPRKPDSTPGSRPPSPDDCPLATANCFRLLVFWSFGLLVPLRALRKEAA